MQNPKSIPARVIIFILALMMSSLTLVLSNLLFIFEKEKIVISLIIYVFILFLLIFYAYFFIYLPYKKATHNIGLYASRHSLDGLSYPPVYLCKEIQSVLDRLKETERISSALEFSTRQAQYVALQNQINPHFLYNTLESIRSEALMAGLTSVAEMCEALATFFRYTISNTESLVTIEEELQNTQIYFYIQKYRFGDRLSLTIDYNEEDRHAINKCKIPKLTLQPIVENAIIHGLEQKIGNGLITINMQITKTRLIITVSDNGIGISPVKLNSINENMVKRKVVNKVRNSGKGIAITNVNNRIKSLFGEEYGVIIFSAQEVGTDVEITLPAKQIHKETL